MFYVGQHQFLMLLFVIETEDDNRLELSREDPSSADSIKSDTSWSMSERY